MTGALEIAGAVAAVGAYLGGLLWATKPLRDYAKNHPEHPSVQNGRDAS